MDKHTMVETVSELKAVALPPVLDISTIQPWHEKLVLYCNNDDYITVDASAVKKITSPGIQLIVSLFKTKSENKRQLSVDNCSHEMKEVLGDFGLLEMIKKWGREL